MSSRLFIGCVLILACAQPAPGFAEGPSTPPSVATSEEQQLHELMSVLQEETAIATKTKVNRDYVPGMDTVLDGDTLEALGARTVLDALSLVPGIQTFRELSGTPNLTMRRIS